MRLLNPTAGEMCDRISILALKIEAVVERPDAAVLTARFIEEQRALYSRMDVVTHEMKHDRCAILFELYGGLFAVNATIWGLVHRVREKRDAEAAVAATFANDRRIEIIARIDKVVHGDDYEMVQGTAYSRGKV